ncbi:MAG: pyruvate kinase [Gammaproteobacteria bacterium]
MMTRRTKIIATLGPATDESGLLEKMLLAGVNLVRINLSHGSHEEHALRIQKVRKIAQKNRLQIGILVDLQGPKIRVTKFKNGSVRLTPGEKFVLDVNFDPKQGTEDCVGVDYKALAQDVGLGDILLLDDGRIMLEVKVIQGSKIHTEVKLGGILSDHKGINLQGGGLSAHPLTLKDKEDMKFATEMGADYLAVSFTRSAEDIIETRKILESFGSKAGVIAKIERVEAVETHTMEAIIRSSDAVMVARGDLGVELGYAELPAIQKKIINKARLLNCAVITATQMMESMINSPIPTRAEVSDVANAVLDGTDAVMLSAETATGAYPDSVVEAMARICVSAEKQRVNIQAVKLEQQNFKRLDEAIAKASMYTANHLLETHAIVALTESGSTPLWMSRIRSGIPIYGLSRHPLTLGKMTLLRGVYPIEFDITQYSKEEIDRAVIEKLKSGNLIAVGDRVIFTQGDVVGDAGHTNSMKILVA